MKINEVCVPVKALALTGEEREAVTPENGDRVSVLVEGRVRIEGDKAYVEAETVNGEPVLAEGAAGGLEDEGLALRAAGEDLDEYA